MRARTSLVLMAAAVCHLLVALPLVTSQLLPGSFSADSLPQAPGKASTAVTIQALQQEKDGAVYKLQGEVRILYGVYRLSADRVTYDQDSGDAEAGANAKIYRTNFRLEGIPVLYLPFATHPVQKAPRQSGFLIPNIGRSSTRGYTVGESVFWAMRRDMDLLAGAEYFSRRGWAPDGEFRMRP